MSNKALATTNILVIMTPFLLGAFGAAFEKQILSQGWTAILGFVMIVVGIWTSLRLAKQPD
jgi:hypothetical protein